MYVLASEYDAERSHRESLEHQLKAADVRAKALHAELIREKGERVRAERERDELRELARLAEPWVRQFTFPGVRHYSDTAAAWIEKYRAVRAATEPTP